MTEVETRADREVGTVTTAPQPDPGALRLAERRHVLDLDDFTRDEIVAIMERTRAMKEVLHRDIKKVPALRGKTIVTLFYEPSTRTRVSFEQAGKILSADVINVSGSGSSVEKGESLYNTALTIQAMNADVIVIRHPQSGRAPLSGKYARKLDHQRRRRGPRTPHSGPSGPVHHPVPHRLY